MVGGDSESRPIRTDSDAKTNRLATARVSSHFHEKR